MNTKILHTVPEFGIKKGGVSTSIYDLISSVREQGGDVDIVSLAPGDRSDKVIGQGESWIKILENDSKTPIAYSGNLREFIRNSNYDLYHTNGLWLYANHITMKIARSKNKPYVITAHGMLYPSALSCSKWKKSIMKKIWFSTDIRNASCIHATCDAEYGHIRDFGYEGPVAIIPNPARIPDYVDPLSAKIKETFFPKDRRSIKKIGFLGRLHPIKRVERIIQGVDLLGNLKNDVELLIIGKGDNQYEQYLNKEVERLGLKNVRFCGFLDGKQKFEILSQLSVLFVPSESENFGMIVTEALACGTPVMASLGTPWKILNDKKCGWWMDCSPENIRNIIETALEMEYPDVVNTALLAKSLVRSKYAADVIAKQMIVLYDYLINGGTRPSFVRID